MRGGAALYAHKGTRHGTRGTVAARTPRGVRGAQEEPACRRRPPRLWPGEPWALCGVCHGAWGSSHGTPSRLPRGSRVASAVNPTDLTVERRRALICISGLILHCESPALSL